ncbi:zinc-ribbon domain-containing protein [Magnetospirillum molischianum]|uniref:Zinc finger/thioredoxin putative domain-containing protein n=1 Tax=Magnetospirillum molischianum DSM 120 TaxID=1150626 RepID=H8FTQ2_MAGML|nr:zinc-ribbon domain-containing protein [Magnetospirillum molischianum]CCG41759.1 conserved hypothetical protein [Magnetospirillum molischianum DSM 120]
MLITCPNCGTNFSIPDAALGTEGRKLKCAKCEHKWFQAPLRLEIEDNDVLDLDFEPQAEPATPSPFSSAESTPTPPPPFPSQTRPVLSAFPDLEPPPGPNFGSRLPPERPDIDLSHGLLSEEPPSVPDIFGSVQEKVPVAAPPPYGLCWSCWSWAGWVVASITSRIRSSIWCPRPETC